MHWNSISTDCNSISAATFSTIMLPLKKAQDYYYVINSFPVLLLTTKLLEFYVAGKDVERLVKETEDDIL